jgi:hypothetical protein
MHGKDLYAMLGLIQKNHDKDGNGIINLTFLLQGHQSARQHPQ